MLGRRLAWALADVVAGSGVRRAGEVEEVRVLFVEFQCAGDRFEHAVGDAVHVAALDAGVVGDADAGEDGDLLAAESGDPAGPEGGKARLLGCDPRSA